ncbi:hypothetical protein JXQ31_20510 [candidate division KSB1 bacterium]|nr:hypothetical protein [candidate division KSB1 bacterium]
MKNLIGVILVLFMGFLFTAATGSLNFSGEWQLNRDKSDFGEGGRGSRMTATKLIVDQKETLKTERFSVNRNDEEVTTEETLTLDGKECKSETNRGERLSKAKFSDDGKSLQIESTITFESPNGEFKMNSKEVWSLENDGNTLVIDYTMTTQRGERTMKIYYDKAKTEKK